MFKTFLTIALILCLVSSGWCAGKGTNFHETDVNAALNKIFNVQADFAALTATGINSTPIGASVPSTGAFSTLSVSGNTAAVITNKLSVFAATTSAELAGVISDETGTGKVVLDTSPALVTPALGAATATSVAIGGGTAITKIAAYAPSLTPVATAAAIGTTQQTFAVTGLATTDKLIVNGPVPTSLCPCTGARVSAVDTLQLDFTTLTAAACTPAAGAYNVVAVRN